jgi:hypothetical protein
MAACLLLAIVACAMQRAGTRTHAAGICTLAVVPSTPTVEQGGIVNLDFASQPSAAIDVLVIPASPFPAAALLFDRGTYLPATVLTGDPVSNGFHYAFATGFDGHALLGIPIPRSAGSGPLDVSATATCGPGDQESAQATTTVAPAQPIPFAGHLFIASHDVVIRTVELPPSAGSMTHDAIVAQTAPSASVALVALLASSNAANLGSSADGGVAHQSGDILYAAEGSADASGQAIFSLPIASDLLMPGRGAVIRVMLSSVSGGVATVYRTSVPIREVPLRLLVQPGASTRGGSRPLFVLGGPSTGESTLNVLVLADKGAHLSGSAAFGATLLTAQGTAGPGDRAMLRFAVPNVLAPAQGSHATARITVTSSFRGAVVTRGVDLNYGRRQAIERVNVTELLRVLLVGLPQ